MKYFSVLYMMPVEGLNEWMNTPEAERKDQETALKEKWNAWLKDHENSVKKTIGLGRSKRVDANGVKDLKNGFMLSSYVEAESLEAAAELFRSHPHLTIPGATIEVMETNSLGK